MGNSHKKGWLHFKLNWRELDFQFLQGYLKPRLNKVPKEKK